MDANAVFDDFRDDIREAILQRLESLAGGSNRLSSRYAPRHQPTKYSGR